MNAYKLPGDRLLVPSRAEIPGAYGDGMREIGKDDPTYNVWLPYAVEGPPPEEEQ